MRNILFGVVLTLVLVFGLRYCEHEKEEKENLIQHTALIEKELKNVGKLIVTEGSFAEVYSYEDSKKFYFDVFSATKKALVVVNAKATISYDLAQVQTEISEENKTVTILYIPEPELNIHPNIEYYDLSQDYLNQFEADDYNKIKARIDTSLRQKIEASNLYTNSENRLISELHKIYVLTSSLGWTLVHENGTIVNQRSFELLD